MRNIKLTIEYDGKDFNGWQKQLKIRIWPSFQKVWKLLKPLILLYFGALNSVDKFLNMDKTFLHGCNNGCKIY